LFSKHIFEFLLYNSIATAANFIIYLFRYIHCRFFNIRLGVINGICFSVVSQKNITVHPFQSNFVRSMTTTEALKMGFYTQKFCFFIKNRNFFLFI